MSLRSKANGVRTENVNKRVIDSKKDAVDWLRLAKIRNGPMLHRIGHGPLVGRFVRRPEPHSSPLVKLNERRRFLRVPNRGRRCLQGTI